MLFPRKWLLVSTGGGVGGLNIYIIYTFFYVQSLILNIQTNYTVSMRYRERKLGWDIYKA